MNDGSPCKEANRARSVDCSCLHHQAILNKYNPSEKITLYGCATASAEEGCTSSTSSLFELEWAQVRAAAHGQQQGRSGNN